MSGDEQPSSANDHQEETQAVKNTQIDLAPEFADGVAAVSGADQAIAQLEQGTSVEAEYVNGHARSDSLLVAEEPSANAVGAEGDTDIALEGRAGFVVLEKPDGPLPTDTIEAIGQYPVVYVTYSGQLEHAEAAREAGAVVVKMRGENETPPARCRNAGFRQLRKIASDIEYVQFMDSGVQVSPAWLAMAVKFLDKRPEVAAVEGKMLIGEENLATDDGGEALYQLDHEEIRASGNNFLVRVKSFVDIGGFRGDLIVTDVQDFCLRSRGRGRFIWRLGMPMAATLKTGGGLGQWWRSARERGFEYAFASALHGGPPERYRLAETRRAVLWGCVLPIIVMVLAAIVTAAFYILAVPMAPIIAGSTVLGAGFITYLLKALFLGRINEDGYMLSLPARMKATMAHFPEFSGVLKFMRWRKKQVRSDNN